MGGVKTPDRPRTPSKRIEGLADTTIHLPQLNSSSARSVEEGDGDSTGLRHAHARRRLPVAGHISTRRLPVHGRTPDCVAVMIAIGQQSTDSFGASRVEKRPTRLRVPPNLIGRVAKARRPTGGIEGQ